MSDSAEVSGNTANSSGGGIYGNGKLTMSDRVKISGNEAKGGSTVGGGGIFLAGGTLTLSDYAEISGNTAPSGRGGGINLSGGTVTMQDYAEISGNETGGAGGGIFMNPAATFIFAGGTMYGRNDMAKANIAEWWSNSGSAKTAGGITDADAAFALSPYTTSDAIIVNSNDTSKLSQAQAVWGDKTTKILNVGTYTNSNVGSASYYKYWPDGSAAGTADSGWGYGGTIYGGSTGRLDPP
jgi:predicted outer membrane repeat protein